MRTPVVLALAVVMLFTTAFAFAHLNEYEVGAMDGSDWNEMTFAEKEAWMTGYVHCLVYTVMVMQAAYKQGPGPDETDMRIFRQITRITKIPLDTLIARITEFYSNEENLDVPLVVVLHQIPHPELSRQTNAHF